MAYRYDFIVNPASGRSRATAVVQAVKARLEGAGHEVAIHTTAKPGDASEYSANLSNGVRAAIVVGGDGTVREVAQGLLGRGIPLAILPAGTENLVAKQFGISSEPACLLQTLARGPTRTIDVGRHGSSIFLVVAGVGFDAEVVQRMTKRRSSHITHLDYFFPVWRTFWEHRFPQLAVRADGVECFRGQGLVFVGNMPRYSLNLKILPRAVVDNGMLDVCIYPCASPAKLLLHALRTACGQHLAWGDAIYLRAKDVWIEGAPSVPIQLDGDVGGVLPARFEILPRALTLRVPPVSSI